MRGSLASTAVDRHHDRAVRGAGRPLVDQVSSRFAIALSSPVKKSL
jgi:hypothetical protein